jgi:tripartite-type tricarboxylate transporter receptor subunit TctC
LNAEIRKMLADPAAAERMNTLAFEPIGGSRAEFAAFIKAEIEKWTKVARASGAKAD